MNVLLSRAKKGLVIVGQRETLQTSDLWSRWLDQAPVLKPEELRTRRNERNESKVVKTSKKLSKQRKDDLKQKKR